METPPSDLHKLIQRCILPLPDWHDAARLIEICRRLALAYLRASGTSVHSLTTRLGLTLEDVAYDSIAELFARGEGGGFKEMQRWAEKNAIASLVSAEQSYHPLRRLVLGAVHDRVYYLYHDADPALARLIRNIKLALPHHPSMKLLRVKGGAFVVPRNSGCLHLDLPSSSPDLLLPLMLEHPMSRDSLRTLLSSLGEVLQGQTSYRRGCTVVEAAILIRLTYSSRKPTVSQPVEADVVLQDSAVEAEIQSVLHEVRASGIQHYIRLDKLTANEGDLLLQVVENVLRAEFLSDDGEGRGYFEHAQSVNGTITRDQYRNRYRVIVEYLAKTARSRLRERLKARL
jgi:hypothetical protein